MKYIRKISLALILCAGVFTSCDDKDNVSISGLNIDRSEITVGENGGIEIINIQSASEWTASSDQPWVNISPASGVGISECIVRIDSSLINDIRTANIRIRPESGLSQNIVVSQTGFEKTISLDVEDVEIDYTAKSSDRYFDIAITTNVLFNINVPQSDNWISFDKDQLDIDLNKGARPRTVKIRFRWNMNVNPEDRISEIGFTSLDEALNLEAILTVKQKSAPLIEDSRSGDSLALMIIQKKIDTYTEFDTGESMVNWYGVKLWERTDKDVTPEMIGRVRSAEFFIYETDDELPAEISKLKYIETLYFSGNINKDRKDLHIGSCLNDLKHLKYLTVTGHGLVELPSELADIKTLEYLNISGNNFVEIPAILNPTDMPSLKHLDFSLNKRNTFDDDKALVVADKMGLYMNISRDHNDARRLLELLSWENLETLRLGNNYIEGELPDLNDFPVKYTAEEVNANDTLPSILIGMPKILPNAKTFSINLNRLTGNIPDWILYHPNLWLWDPYTLIFSQDLGMNTDGVRVRFDNVPSSWEYYYEQYPLRRPVLTD